MQVRRRKRGRTRFATQKCVKDIIKELVKVCSDETFANYVNRNGYRTGHGNRWTRQQVESFRSKRRIPKCTPQRKAEQGWMNLTEASAYLGESSTPLRKAVERNQLHAAHPVPEGPWIFSRADLDTPETKAVVEAIKYRRVTPVKRNYG